MLWCSRGNDLASFRRPSQWPAGHGWIGGRTREICDCLGWWGQHTFPRDPRNFVPPFP